MSLQRLAERIRELEWQRAELESTLSSIAAPASPPPADWEARLSAARAVDALTGSTTAQTVEAQRQADLAQREQQARKAAKEALQATQQREAMESLTRDLEAAQGLLARSVRDAAQLHLPDCESRYQAACAARLEAAADLAGWLSLCGRESEAHRMLREVGYAGDTMTVIGHRVTALRADLLNEEETENA